MTNHQDFVGCRFGRLVITAILSKTNSHRQRMCIAICDCGITKTYVLLKLKNGTTKSCKCMRQEILATHSITHGLSKHPLFGIWIGIKSRCYNPNMDNYEWYGGLGVAMCELWLNSFQSFYDWAIKNGWESGLEIDRFPNRLGDYSPDNCRIVTHKINMNNTSWNRILSIGDENFTLKQASDKYNISYAALKSRLNRGWDDYTACHTPVRYISPSLPKKALSSM